MRPRFNHEELALIEYSLRIVHELASLKLKESDRLSYDLKRLARYIWFSGDRKALEIYKPFKKYALTSIHNPFQIEKSSRLLQRRVEGLLNGRKFHSVELEPLELKKSQ